MVECADSNSKVNFKIMEHRELSEKEIVDIKTLHDAGWSLDGSSNTFVKHCTSKNISVGLKIENN